jgi:hypothetical protein
VAQSVAGHQSSAGISRANPVHIASGNVFGNDSDAKRWFNQPVFFQQIPVSPATCDARARFGQRRFRKVDVSKHRSLILLCVLTFILSCFAIAQSSLSGAIGGSAWDAHHAALSGAQITLQGADTGEYAEARSGPNGVFRIVGLKPGAYSLKATSTGFADFQMLHVIVEVGRITELEIPFAVSAKPEVVEVRDEAPAVNTSTPDFASNVNDAAINNLPINGRRWSNFALLTPGATLDGNFGLISFLSRHQRADE